MTKFPYPDIILKNIYELSPETLTQKGIKFLLMDLDNTLAPYSLDAPHKMLCDWVEGLKKEGIVPFILSNNHGDRPQTYAEAMDVDFIRSASKPSTEKLFEVLEAKGYKPEETAIIGDQIYTDVLCGRRAGILTIVVQPISLKNPLHGIRYFSEFPFRRQR